MKGKRSLAALVLTGLLALAAAGCRNTADAGASASRWDRRAEKQTARAVNEARGPLSDGRYAADGTGRVSGFDGAEDPLSRAGREMSDAGRSLLRRAGDAADNAGDLAERAMDSAAEPKAG